LRVSGVFSFAVALVFAALAGAAFAVTSQECAECHDESPAAHEQLAKSVHDGADCTDCHVDITELPHDELAPAACGSCHEDAVATYTMHGRGQLGVTPDLPLCQDCHGTHDMLSGSDPQSKVHPRNLVATCGHCHANLDLAKEHDIRLKRPTEVYEASVHGEATGGGVTLAATCNDCHSTDGNAHKILGPGDPQSSINHFNIPNTCGKCHETIAEEYWEGIHGVLTKRGETDTPVCTHCHGEHGILQVDDPRAQVSPTRVAEATCAPCHESAALNEKYGLPAGRLASFVDSYHGVKSKAGDATVANCASCHGAHRILPSTDPTSSIATPNLARTCGECHPGISESLAQVKIHESGTGMRAGWPKVISIAYMILIVGVIGFMLVYCALDFRKYVLLAQRQPMVQRMNANSIWQHALLIVSFLTLVVTGFALRYSEHWPFHVIFGWDGGYQVRGIVHRAAAGVFLFDCLWHLVYLRTQPGRKFFREMLLSPKDFREMFQTIAYNIGRAPRKPVPGFFGHAEKIEYWALVWGTLIMTVSGFFLWFDNFAVRIFHKGIVDVMLVIHFYEALLATLAVAIWHSYGTVFSPAVYPGNMAWITGRAKDHTHGAEDAELHPPAGTTHSADGKGKLTGEAAASTLPKVP